MIGNRAPGFFFPMEIWADIRTAAAASLTGKPRLEIGKPDVIGPSIAVDRCVVAAAEIRAVDQETTNARGAHFGEGDFLSDDRGPHKVFTEAATTGEISLSILESVSKPSRIVG